MTQNDQDYRIFTEWWRLQHIPYGPSPELTDAALGAFQAGLAAGRAEVESELKSAQLFLRKAAQERDALQKRIDGLEMCGCTHDCPGYLVSKELSNHD